jgi:hypothetical protein
MDAALLISFVTSFFAGAFFCNAVPHVVRGLTGQAFPTPFAKPPGVGLSSARVNFLWGFANLVVGWALVAWHPLRLGGDSRWLTFALGVLLLGIYTSWRFAEVMRRNPER